MGLAVAQQRCWSIIPQGTGFSRIIYILVEVYLRQIGLGPKGTIFSSLNLTHTEGELII